MVLLNFSLFLLLFRLKMPRKSVVAFLAALIVVILVSVTIGECGSHDLSSSGFQKLNRRLSKVKSGNAAAYLEAAKKELRRFNSGGLTLFKSAKFGAALRGFTKLERVLKEQTCDIYEYQILKDFGGSTGAHKYVTDHAITKLPPVARTVHEISLMRAKKCMPLWIKKFKFAYDTIRQETKDMAEFKRHKSLAKKKKMNDIQYMAWIVDFTFTDGEFTLNEAIEHINRYSADDLDQCLYRSMIKKYMRIPCREYAEELYPLGVQILFDAEMFLDKTGFDFGDESKIEGNEMVPYYQALAHAKACAKVDTDKFEDELYNYWYKFQEKNNTECSQELRATVSSNSSERSA